MCLSTNNRLLLAHAGAFTQQRIQNPAALHCRTGLHVAHHFRTLTLTLMGYHEVW